MQKIGNLTYTTRINPATEEHLPAEGRRKVFISYKKSDNRLSGIRDIAIKKILRLVDVAVWYDENLTPGEKYIKEITIKKARKWEMKKQKWNYKDCIFTPKADFCIHFI